MNTYNSVNGGDLWTLENWEVILTPLLSLLLMVDGEGVTRRGLPSPRVGSGVRGDSCTEEGE